MSTALSKAVAGEKIPESKKTGVLNEALDKLKSTGGRISKAKEMSEELADAVIATAETQGTVFAASFAEGYFGEEKMDVGPVDLRLGGGLLLGGYGLYKTMTGKGGSHALAIGNALLATGVGRIGRHAPPQLKGDDIGEIARMVRMTPAPRARTWPAAVAAAMGARAAPTASSARARDLPPHPTPPASISTDQRTTNMARIWALVTFTADGECLVDRTSLRASLDGFDGEPSFGSDFDGDDDLGDDDLGDDDLGDDDLGDDDLGDDDLGDDDLGDDDLGDDDLGDDDLGEDDGVAAARKRRRRRRARQGSSGTKRRETRLARQNKQLKGRLKKAKKGKVVQRNVTVTVATSVGQSMSVTLTPRTSLHLSKIFATGDTAATINTIISGDDPVVLDNLDAPLISPNA